MVNGPAKFLRRNHRLPGGLSPAIQVRSGGRFMLGSRFTSGVNARTSHYVSYNIPFYRGNYPVNGVVPRFGSTMCHSD